MNFKLTTFAFLPLVFLAQVAGAARLTRCVSSAQRLGSFPLSMNLVEVSIVSAGDEREPKDWSVFAWAFEPGSEPKLDSSILRFHHGADSMFTEDYPSLTFHYATDERFASNYSISGFSRLNYSTFAGTEFLALDPRIASFFANEGVDATLAAIDEVRPEVTFLSGNEAAKALSRAWKRATKQKPSFDTLVVLTAHWAHETAAGTSMYNHNFGGIKGRGQSGLSCLRGAREGFGYRTRVGRDRFRAYPDVASGADDYVSLLLRKYPTALEASERGEVSEFVQALYDGGYFTGSEQDYERSLLEHRIRAEEWALSVLGGTSAIEIPSPTTLADPTASP
jgi:hypothetical protein